MSFRDLGFAKVDLDRRQRCGFPEIVFGEKKTPAEVVRIVGVLVEEHGVCLVTRASKNQFSEVSREYPDAVFHDRARCITLVRSPLPTLGGEIGLVCAGTSDIAVAEEAAVTLEFLGNKVKRIYDVGVAGLHRLMAARDQMMECRVLIVVAGMEGALPSAVAGLVSSPIIAVPTSVGYGASFQGLSALLGMLNSCGSGVTVVNIDNGFGAAFAAAQINRAISAAQH